MRRLFHCVTSHIPPRSRPFQAIPGHSRPLHLTHTFKSFSYFFFLQLNLANLNKEIRTATTRKRKFQGRAEEYEQDVNMSRLFLAVKALTCFAQLIFIIIFAFIFIQLLQRRRNCTATVFGFFNYLRKFYYTGRNSQKLFHPLTGINSCGLHFLASFTSLDKMSHWIQSKRLWIESGVDPMITTLWSWLVESMKIIRNQFRNKWVSSFGLKSDKKILSPNLLPRPIALLV